MYQQPTWWFPPLSPFQHRSETNKDQTPLPYKSLEARCAPEPLEQVRSPLLAKLKSWQERNYHTDPDYLKIAGFLLSIRKGTFTESRGPMKKNSLFLEGSCDFWKYHTRTRVLWSEGDRGGKCIVKSGRNWLAHLRTLGKGSHLFLCSFPDKLAHKLLKSLF